MERGVLLNGGIMYTPRLRYISDAVKEIKEKTTDFSIVLAPTIGIEPIIAP